MFMNRLDGTLALSRAMGDLSFKDKVDFPAEEQALTAFPDVFQKKRDDNDFFIILACDGIWDCVTNTECIEKLSSNIA